MGDIDKWAQEKLSGLRVARNVMSADERGPDGPHIPVSLDEMERLVEALAERETRIAELERRCANAYESGTRSARLQTDKLRAELTASEREVNSSRERIAELESWLPFSTERTRRDARELLGETWAYKPEGSLPGASVSVVRSGVALDVINTLLGSVDTLNARLAELEGRPTHESVAEVRTELIDILSVLAPDDHSKLSTLILVKMFGVYSAEVEQVAENLVRLIGIEPKATVREDLEVLAAWVLEVRKNH